MVSGENRFKCEFSFLKMWNPLPLSQACKVKGSTSTFGWCPHWDSPNHHNRCTSATKEGGWFHCLTWAPQSETDHYVHFARSKVGLGSQSLLCNTLVQHVHPHFIVFLFWPLIMISRTWERSIILVSISMMSGCSRAPLMNSSSVNSPCDREKDIKISLEKQNPQQRKCRGRTKTLYLLHWHLSCHI